METRNNSSRQIRNPRLCELFERLTRCFLDALDTASFIPEYGTSYDRVRAIIGGNPDLIARILEIRPDLSEKGLSSCLLSTRDCLEALLKERVSHTPPHASTTADYEEELAMFLDNLFKIRKRMRLRALFANRQAFEKHFRDIFLREYARHENYLYDDAVCDFFLCPLENFIGSKSIDLESGILIRSINQEEFHSLVEADEAHGYELTSYPEFVLYVPADEGNWRESVERAVTSLRLLSKERVGLSRIYHGYALPSRPWNILESPPGTNFARRADGALFNLVDSQEEELRRLFSLLGRAKEAGYLIVSMHRFNLAYERETLEDSWIDYFVSLESLFSKGDELTEVTHRLATRVSRALADLFDSKKKMAATIKQWYKIRSRIIHGMQVDMDEGRLEDLKEIVRRSIVWFLNQKEYTNHDKLIDMLDYGS